MDKDLTNKVFIGLILLVGLFPSLSFILVRFIENVVTPVGKIKDLAWALNSTDPWVIVSRLTLLLIIGSITTAILGFIIAWIKEKIRL